MKWTEFKSLLGGINSDTALGRIVGIRSEKDKEILKNYTPEMRKLRSDWQNRMAREKTETETADFLESMKQALIKMAGDQNS